MQVKLLRALQEGEVDPVGSKRPVKVDVRIMSATNRDLALRVRDGHFREDLYYRLNVFPIVVPALRDRRADIPELARHFIARFAAEENKPMSGLTPEAARLLEHFSWPGNVRQLENTIFRAVVLCESETLEVCDFPQIATAMGLEAKPQRMPGSPDLSRTNAGTGLHSPTYKHASPYALSGTDNSGHMRKLEDIESEVIRMAIARYDGHMSEVARRLGIGRSTLYRKLKELGLEHIASSEEPSENVGEQARRAAGAG
jgi:DNA-binding NtrC family response regulator